MYLLIHAGIYFKVNQFQCLTAVSMAIKRDVSAKSYQPNIASRILPTIKSVILFKMRDAKTVSGVCHTLPVLQLAGDADLNRPWEEPSSRAVRQSLHLWKAESSLM